MDFITNFVSNINFELIAQLTMLALIVIAGPVVIVLLAFRGGDPVNVYSGGEGNSLCFFSPIPQFGDFVSNLLSLECTLVRLRVQFLLS
ncbi:MAG: photosystem II reaction center protein Ycf12 [Limnoraphis sp. WC205]|nr:photosystem II reaction center protein Ycf12 [Limnoraphis sp. WC205]